MKTLMVAVSATVVIVARIISALIATAALIPLLILVYIACIWRIAIGKDTACKNTKKVFELVG